MFGVDRRNDEMATTYGKVLRRIRIDRDELLKMTSAYLSSIENGKRQIPNNMTRSIVDIYELDKNQMDELYNAEAHVRTNIDINLEEASSSQKTTVLALARQFENLTDEQLKDIQVILNKAGD